MTQAGRRQCRPPSVDSGRDATCRRCDARFECEPHEQTSCRAAPCSETALRLRPRLAGRAPAARARRLPVLLRDLRLVHEPRRRQCRRVDRVRQFPLSARLARLRQRDLEHHRPRRRLRRLQAVHRPRACAARQSAPARARRVPLAPDAAVGDARLRRVPHLARALSADRRRHQSRADDDRALPGHHRLARPARDGDAGGHRRFGLARLSVLVREPPRCAADDPGRALRGRAHRRRQCLAAILGGDVSRHPPRHHRHDAACPRSGLRTPSRTSGS